MTNFPLGFQADRPHERPGLGEGAAPAPELGPGSATTRDDAGGAPRRPRPGCYEGTRRRSTTGGA